MDWLLGSETSIRWQVMLDLPRVPIANQSVSAGTRSLVPQPAIAGWPRRD
jgi:hypothetical protein